MLLVVFAQHNSAYFPQHSKIAIETVLHVEERESDRAAHSATQPGNQSAGRVGYVFRSPSSRFPKSEKCAKEEDQKAQRNPTRRTLGELSNDAKGYSTGRGGRDSVPIRNSEPMQKSAGAADLPFSSQQINLALELHCTSAYALAKSSTADRLARVA